MPKSTKKKKDKAADFSKAKLKLGKGKQVANNAVDTSFKARSIALPSQSIAQGRDSETPVTKRKLTIDDLISQLGHYNPSARRDAIVGLRELFSEYPSLAINNLTTVINRCVRIIADNDASVRKTLLGFIAWFIPFVPKNDLQPHTPVLLLFTTSALTHIFPEIRVDAVMFLNILLEHMSETVVEGWASDTRNHGRRVLEGYLGLLNAGTAFGGEGDPMRATSTASVVLSPKSKLAVLSSLSNFLKEAMTIGDRPPTSSFCPIPTWFFASSFASVPAFHAFRSSISPTEGNCDELAPIYQCLDDDNCTQDGDSKGFFMFAQSSIADSWTLEHLFDVDIGQLSVTAHLGISASTELSLAEGDSYVSHLASALHPTLLSTFLDCAPVAFSSAGNSSETELKMVLAVAEIVRSLYGGILKDPSKSDNAKYKTSENLSAILGYMSPYFPFFAGGSILAKRDIKIESIMETLNLIFCELTSLLVLATSLRHSVARKLSNPASSTLSHSGGVPLQIERVQEYVTRLLRGELPRGANLQNSLPHLISHASYAALLPTIWALISNPEQKQTPDDMLIALVDQALRTSSVSAAKRGTLEFLGLLTLLDTEAQYGGFFTLARNPVEHQKFREWLLHLPKVLWELGGHNLHVTEIILRLLLRLSQRKSVLLDASTSAALRARLVPYFMITHATRGKFPGPFAKLPPSSAARRLALDVAAILPISSRDTDELAQAVGEAVGETVDDSYWRTIAYR